MSNTFIIQKVVDKLNEKGFNKSSLLDITEEDLKPILTEIYQKYHSFGGLEKSPKEKWKKLCLEIIQEFNPADIGNINYDNNNAAEYENIEENENNSESNSQKSDSVKSKSDDEADKNSNSNELKSDDDEVNDYSNPDQPQNYVDPAQTKNDNEDKEDSNKSDIHSDMSL